HVWRHVDADDASGRSDLLRSEEAVEAAARPAIEDRLAHLERGDRLRVAASKAHVRALGNRREILGRVAELPARVGARATAAAGSEIGRRRSRDLAVRLAHGRASLVFRLLVHLRDLLLSKT